MNARSLYNLVAARTATQLAHMEELEATGTCVFCPGNQTESIIHQGMYWFVTMNRYPYVGTLAHYLIVSRAHVRSFSELPDDAGAEFWSIRRMLQDRERGPASTATVERSGDMRYNGSSIAHLHIHFVVPDLEPCKTVRFRVSAIGSYEKGEARILESLEEVVAEAELLRKSARRIVLTSGSFDLIHLGHVKYLQRAREQGDVLIVGVDSDEKIRQRKGPDRPLVPEEERTQVLALQRPVDLIYLKQPNEMKWALIRAVKPESLVVTSNHDYDKAELEALHEYCGRVVVVERQASVTTSERIRQMYMHLGDRLGPKLAESLPDLIDSILRGT